MEKEKVIIDCISDYKKVINSIRESKSNIILKHFDNKFKITKHKDGDYPAIVTISGFGTEDADNRLKWRNFILKKYPEREWFHVEWNAEKFPYSNNEKNPMPIVYDGESPNRDKRKYLVKVPLSFTLLGRCILLAESLANNFWHRAIRNAKIAGKMLAVTLDACPKKNFILFGHSLGARIIYNCLEELNLQGSSKKIVEVHLFGGAVGSNAAKWEKACERVYERVYNYYSTNDLVLKFAYSLPMFSFSPIGINRIAYARATNHDLSKVISGHSSYFSYFGGEKKQYKQEDKALSMTIRERRQIKLRKEVLKSQYNYDKEQYEIQKKKYG